MDFTPQRPEGRMPRHRAHTNAFEFAADLERAARVLGIDSARDTAVTIALQLDRLIVQGTPKDTGRAQANWFLSEGEPRTDTTESTTPEARPKLTGERAIFLSNSLDYIVPLEYGHSSQAPAGMVRKALAEVQAIVSV